MDDVQHLAVQGTGGDGDVAIEEDLMLADGDEDFGEEEEIFIVDDGAGQSEATNKFDLIVGALEDYLMDEEFEQLRTSFCRTNCQHFEAEPENKLIYMDLFQQYTALIEKSIEQRLEAVVEGFDMQEFFSMLQMQQEESASEVFDLLLSMAEFEAFKELMLSYKDEMAGKNTFQISVVHMPIHMEEEEGGDSRPDLDFGITITAVSPTKRK